MAGNKKGCFIPLEKFMLGWVFLDFTRYVLSPLLSQHFSCIIYLYHSEDRAYFQQVEARGGGGKYDEIHITHHTSTL